MPQSWLFKGSSAFLGKTLQQHQYVQFTTSSQHFAKRWKEKSVPAYTSRWRPQYIIQSIAFKLRHSGFRIQWETLLEWRLPSLTRLKWCQFLSHLRSWLGLMEVFILLFAVQVRFKTTQVESGEVWALCLVRLWTRKNSSTSVWWNLWGTQKIFNWGENLLNYADSESQLPEAC